MTALDKRMPAKDREFEELVCAFEQYFSKYKKKDSEELAREFVGLVSAFEQHFSKYKKEEFEELAREYGELVSAFEKHFSKYKKEEPEMSQYGHQSLRKCHVCREQKRILGSRKIEGKWHCKECVSKHMGKHNEA